MVAAQDHDLRALAPEMAQLFGNGSRVCVVRRDPGDVADVQTLRWQRGRRLDAGVEVPVAGRIAESIGMRTDGVRCAGLVIGLWVLRIRFAPGNPDERELRIPFGRIGDDGPVEKGAHGGDGGLKAHRTFSHSPAATNAHTAPVANTAVQL